MLRQLLNDEAGFLVSAELVLIATILVLGLIVGLSQVQHAIVEELNDVAHAIGSLNQSFFFGGFASAIPGVHLKSWTPGSAFHDEPDACDTGCDIVSCDASAECEPAPAP